MEALVADGFRGCLLNGGETIRRVGDLANC